MLPFLSLCPTASSRMKRGRPRVARAITYGIRKAPGVISVYIVINIIIIIIIIIITIIFQLS